MTLIASDTGGGSFKLIPAGVHVGRCYRVIDLGTQEETYEGETKLLPKLCIYWELHGEDDEGNPLMTDDGNAMVIWQEFTRSLGKKAKLRATLESWRGRPFSDDELKGFDVSKLLGAYCMVNITHKTSGQGKTYANVSSLTPLPSALRNAKPEPYYENVMFDLDNFDDKVFATFHQKLQERINGSMERSGKKVPLTTAKVNEQLAEAAADDVDADIPF